MFLTLIIKEIKPMIKKTALLASALSLALVGTVAHAQGPYVGVSAGISDYDTDGVEFDNATSFKALGGYQINDNFAIEAAYINFGDAELEELSLIEVNVTSLGVAGVGIVPINESVSLFGKVGFHSWDAELTAPGFEKESDDGVDFNLGVGAEFHATEQVSLIAELEHYKVDSEAINNASIGVRVYF
jgi:OOP family OmpA-OmpF porin